MTTGPVKGRSGGSLWLRLSLMRSVRNSHAQEDAQPVDTTNTTRTRRRSTDISACAVGVFYRGIFLRAAPVVYTEEWYTGSTFGACDADVHVPAGVHEDARHLEDTIRRLARRMTPSSIDSIEETEEDEDAPVRPRPADFTPATCSARNTEEQAPQLEPPPPHKHPHEPQSKPQQVELQQSAQSSALDPPPKGWQWVRRAPREDSGASREVAVTESSQPKASSRTRRRTRIVEPTVPPSDMRG